MNIHTVGMRESELLIVVIVCPVLSFLSLQYFFNKF
jgi:hypothetical protein